MYSTVGDPTLLYVVQKYLGTIRQSVEGAGADRPFQEFDPSRLFKWEQKCEPEGVL